MRRLDLAGRTFGRLLVKEVSRLDKRGECVWLCFCICGTAKEVRGGDLRSGNTLSCGCLRDELVSQIGTKYNTKHGLSNGPEWYAYYKARARCTNPNDKAFKWYGARGIRFLFTSFEQFYQELGPKLKGLVLDRIENDGNYEPGNVRWATVEESNNNKRMGNQWR